MLQMISNEKEELIEKLQLCEIKEEDYILSIEANNLDLKECSSLSDELELTDPQVLNSCDPCYSRNNQKKSYSSHIKDLKLKADLLERTIFQQKLILSSSIMKLKDKEFMEKQSCNCRRICRIHHSKHNWKKLKMSDLLLKFHSCLHSPGSFSCNHCDQMLGECYKS